MKSRAIAHSPGFSLIELMVTLAVMGLLLMAVAPSISEWMVNLRIRNTAETLLTGLQTARTEAVRRNQNVGFWMVNNTSSSCSLSAQSASWVVSAQSPIGHCADNPSTTTAPMLVVTQPMATSDSTTVSVTGLQSDNSTSASSVLFNGFGQVTGTGGLGRIDVLSANSSANYRSMRIIVTASGGIRMCDPAVTAASDPRKCPTS